MDAAGKPVQTARPGHRRDSCDGQADGADGKARKGRPETGTGLCAQMRRENQVPGSEKHGK